MKSPASYSRSAQRRSPSTTTPSLGIAGARLRAIATLDDQSHRSAKAIAWIQGNYDKPVHVKQLANVAGMGVTTLHHHFRFDGPLRFPRLAMDPVHPARPAGEQLDVARWTEIEAPAPTVAAARGGERLMFRPPRLPASSVSAGSSNSPVDQALSHLHELEQVKAPPPGQPGTCS